MRGPNLRPNLCTKCGAKLDGRNHRRYMGRLCRTHYRIKENARKGDIRRDGNDNDKEKKGLW